MADTNETQNSRSTENQKLSDTRNKISLIQTVINKCDYLLKNPVELENPNSATMFFTNESSSSIEEATRNPKARDLRELFDIHQELKTTIKQVSILSSHIHSILYEFYVSGRTLLDFKTLIKEMENYGVYYDQKEILRDRGFIWREIGNDKKCILIEDPEIQAKRNKYLLDMKKFRKNDSIFVYVEEKAIPTDAETLQKYRLGYQFLETGDYRYVKLAVSPQFGVMCLSNNNTEETVSDWLTKEVAQYLKPSFVLVFDEDMIKEEPIETPPGPESRKIEMINWLERHNIPCNKTMHRADLYELIDMCKDKINTKKYMTDEIIKSKGVEVVKRPKGWPELNYFEPIWLMDALWQQVLDGNIGSVVGKRLEMALTVCSIASWEQYDKILEKKELKVFEKDMELEEVIDKLLNFTKDMTMSDTDLPNIWEVKENNVENIVRKFSSTW